MLVLRELQIAEYARHHFASDKVVVMERPAYLGIIAFCLRLCDVVKEGGPACPHVVGGGSHFVKHFHRMEEIVLVASSLYHLYPVHGVEVGEENLQQAGTLHQQPANRRTRRHHDFRKLGLDTLL